MDNECKANRLRLSLSLHLKCVCNDFVLAAVCQSYFITGLLYQALGEWLRCLGSNRKELKSFLSLVSPFRCFLHIFLLSPPNLTVSFDFPPLIASFSFSSLCCFSFLSASSDRSTCVFSTMRWQIPMNASATLWQCMMAAGVIFFCTSLMWHALVAQGGFVLNLQLYKCYLTLLYPHITTLCCSVNDRRLVLHELLFWKHEMEVA